MIPLFRANNIPEMKAEIQKSGGKVLVIVHPYYEKYDPFYTRHPQNAEKARRLENRLEKWLSSSSSRRPPVFVLEEESVVWRTSDHLSELGAKHVYYVPTEAESPTPIFQAVYSNGHNTDGNWDQFSKVLKSLGVRKIYIGGMWLESQDSVIGCVNGATDQLQKTFPVEITSFSFPLTRAHFKQSKVASSQIARVSM